MKEQNVSSISGIPMLLAILASALACSIAFLSGIANTNSLMIGGSLLIGLILFVMLFGLFMIEPNQAAVLSLFGKYIGTAKEPGLRWNNPFYAKKKISLRVRNFESSKLKVNDLEGSPIEIAAVASGGFRRGGLQRR